MYYETMRLYRSGKGFAEPLLVPLPNDVRIRLRICEIPTGNDELRDLYYQYIHPSVIIIVYAVDNRQSFTIAIDDVRFTTQCPVLSNKIS